MNIFSTDIKGNTHYREYSISHLPPGNKAAPLTAYEAPYIGHFKGYNHLIINKESVSVHNWPSKNYQFTNFLQ